MGTKRWELFEYGSTSFALVMHLAMLTQNPIPFGMIAILGQIALLTFLDLKARPLFVSESLDANACQVASIT